MQHDFKKNNPPMSQEKLQKILQSPEAQKLIEMLSQDGGNALQQASQAASRGEYDAVKQILSPKLQSAQAEALIKKLEQNS